MSIRTLVLPWPVIGSTPTIWPPTIPRALRETLTAVSQWAPWVFPAKNPGDVLLYGVDVSPWLADTPGDTLARLFVTVSPSGDLIVGNPYVNGNVGLFLASAGADDGVYSMEMAFSSTQGLGITRTFFLPVSSQYADLAASTVDPIALSRWFVNT